MKTIGLLGGMSWESTVGYYQAINRGVKTIKGDLHSAKIAMVSVDFAPIEAALGRGEWDTISDILCRKAKDIESAGADFLLICTNTMHKLAPQISDAVKIPLLHIADATADALIRNDVKTVGLIGTATTMEDEFYKGRLEEKYHMRVLVPSKPDRKLVDRVIFKELCLGKIEAASRRDYLRVIDELHDQGAQAVILGCTEISMLVQQADTKVRLFDTTAIHASSAVERALET